MPKNIMVPTTCRYVVLATEIVSGHDITQAQFRKLDFTHLFACMHASHDVSPLLSSV